MLRRSLFPSSLLLCKHQQNLSDSTIIREAEAEEAEEDDQLDLYISNSRELKGMPDLAEKRWNAKFLAESAEEARKNEAVVVASSSSSSSGIEKDNGNKGSNYLDPDYNPLHPDLVHALHENLKKFLKTQKLAASSSTTTSSSSISTMKEIHQNLFSGPRWFTKHQLMMKGYKLQQNPTPIFAAHYGKKLHLINLGLFPESTRRDFVEPELVQQYLSVEQRQSNRPHWLLFSATKKSENTSSSSRSKSRKRRDEPHWQSTNTKTLLNELVRGQEMLRSESCLWIGKDVAERLNLEWKKDVVNMKKEKQLDFDRLFDSSDSCLLFEPRQTEAFFNEKQVIIPHY